MIDQLKEIVMTVLTRFAELKRELAEAKAAPEAEPTAIAEANERAAAAEAKVAELEQALAELQTEDAAESEGISEVLGQLSAALAE